MCIFFRNTSIPHNAFGGFSYFRESMPFSHLNYFFNMKKNQSPVIQVLGIEDVDSFSQRKLR